MLLTLMIQVRILVSRQVCLLQMMASVPPPLVLPHHRQLRKLHTPRHLHQLIDVYGSHRQQHFVLPSNCSLQLYCGCRPHFVSRRRQQHRGLLRLCTENQKCFCNRQWNFSLENKIWLSDQLFRRHENEQLKQQGLKFTNIVTQVLVLSLLTTFICIIWLFLCQGTFYLFNPSHFIDLFFEFTSLHPGGINGPARFTGLMWCIFSVDQWCMLILVVDCESHRSAARMRHIFTSCS